MNSTSPDGVSRNDTNTLNIRHYHRKQFTISAIVEEESDTELPDILNVGDKIDDINSNKSLPVKTRKIQNVTVENNKIEKQKNDSQQQWIGYC